MAKDNPEVATAQYKVLIRRTDVGLLVMKRLQRPPLDKSAERRGLMELAYAAEQAGFILDLTILKNGVQVWDVQPLLVSEAGLEHTETAESTKAAAPAQEAASSTREADPAAGADVSREMTVEGQPLPGALTPLVCVRISESYQSRDSYLHNSSGLRAAFLFFAVRAILQGCLSQEIHIMNFRTYGGGVQ